MDQLQEVITGDYGLKGSSCEGLGGTQQGLFDGSLLCDPLVKVPSKHLFTKLLSDLHLHEN